MDLVSKILNGNQEERYSIEQIRAHPWMKKHPQPQSEGIIVGFNKIPIENEVLGRMKGLGFDPDYVGKCLEANRHNNATTSYYLSLKQFISEGGVTSCDMTSKAFDKTQIEPQPPKNTDARLLIDNYFTKST